jgi:hypothetical protein
VEKLVIYLFLKKRRKNMTDQPESKDDRIQELMGKLRDSSMTDDEWKEFVDLTHYDPPIPAKSNGQPKKD